MNEKKLTFEGIEIEWDSDIPDPGKVYVIPPYWAKKWKDEGKTDITVGMFREMMRNFNGENIDE